MPSLPFTDGFYQLPNTSIANVRCVNWFPTISQGGSRSQSQLLGIEGIETLADLSAKVRGSIYFQGAMYYLAGENFVRLDATLTVAVLATGVVGSSKVFMAENGLAITIVNPYGNSYFYDEVDGFEQIVDADFLELTAGDRAIGVCYSDGFFVYNTKTKIFNGSIKTTNRGKNFNALEYIEAEQFTDNMVRVISSQGNFYAFGELSFEIYRLKQASTTGEFPFQRVASQNNNYGLTGRYNLIEANSTIYFIGGSKREKASVWMLQGAAVTKISTDAVDYLIDVDSPNSSYAFAYTLGGHFHRGFTFPKTSIVYDASTQKWHERQSNRLTTGWQVQAIDGAFGKLLAANTDGLVGEIRQDTFTEYGSTIYDYFTTQPFANQQKAIACHRLEAVCQAGVGNSDDLSPTIAMSHSRDGVNFSDERYRDLGAAGFRNQRQVWRNLGRFDQDVVFRFSVSAPVRKAVISLEATFI